jgi:hypothetical protein
VSSAQEAKEACLAPMRRELGIRGGARLLRWSRPPPNCRAGDVSDDDSPRLMLIRLSDDSFVEDLCLHFHRSGFTAQRAGGSMVEVSRSDAPSPEQARREIELHLTVWRATNPGVGAELVG